MDLSSCFRRAGSVALLFAATAAPAAGQWPVPAASGSNRFIVNTTHDAETPAPGEVTLRAALAAVRSGGRITFAPSLNGGEILLTQIGETNTLLVGESFPTGAFAGFVERDYGRSALVARKNVTLDASSLPLGVTLRWAGNPATPARVLAVLGNVTLRNITVAGGRSVAEARADGAQPFTLARGGGLAVWGKATLVGCTFHDNQARGDSGASRDRGAFGGAVYGDSLAFTDCRIVGNTVQGFGAAGGGIYAVGGGATAAGPFAIDSGGRTGTGSSLTRCVVSGNRAQGQHAYGGGIYSDGGGPGNRMTLRLVNCTIARNLVADNPDIPEAPRSQYYCRGGGVYMSNGSLNIDACTIAENEVTGHPAVFRNRPNLGGGGIAATIGNAHVVESMQIAHSIIAGNSVNAGSDDVYTGSLVHFYSSGNNLFGTLDMSQMLVPIPLWKSLHRRHWPAPGDLADVNLDDAIDRAAAATDATLISAGVAEGTPAALAYPPRGPARNRVPASYRVPLLHAQWSATAGATEPNGEVLTALLARYARVHPGVALPAFGDLDAIRFLAEPEIWPSLPENADWIAFWRSLEAAGAALGPHSGLDDIFWATFKAQPAEGPVRIRVTTTNRLVRRQVLDQTGRRRTSGNSADCGAIEAP